MSDTQHIAEHDVTEIIPEATGYKGCFGCAKCTSGCPVAAQMDVKPHQAMRLLQLDQAEQLLTAASPWICVGCQTCLARCPNEVDIPAALASIRAEAVRRGLAVGAKNVLVFDDLLLGMIKRAGRVNDGMVAMRYKLRRGGLVKDWRTGLKMFKAGKLKLTVPRVDDLDSVERLFTEHPANMEDVE